ncbi:MAG: Asp-tRNA(Asn)/Glu-tRNA(Gln) amidotransferase subunit GatA, partial [Nitrosopumilus sp.]|nr:Asp-tRNA(Asn)/Glu-tRNA(Gln) amidotransferase subunit GatA [Nitrosopumilus sp.]
MNLKISALQFTRDVKSGNISAEDFVAKTMEQIQNVDDKLHAFLSLNDKAIDQAREIDKKIKSGQRIGQCAGMPISIKDNICIKDTKTTCAS